MTRNSKRTSGIPGVVIWVLVSCFISENSTFICMDCTLFGMSIAVGFCVFFLKITRKSSLYWRL